MIDLCRGELTEAKGAPKCPRRTECAHYRALLDWLSAQADFIPDPIDVTIRHRMCQTTDYERFQRREASEP